MIDEISNIVINRKYQDDNTEITNNMEMLKKLVDELHTLSINLTPKDNEITSILGKQKCNVALNYINDYNTSYVYNDHLDDDFTKVNIAYTTYIRYRTALFSDKFEEHKQKFLSELANFKKNLIEKVYSTFEYGDSEYCQDKRANDVSESDDLIKSVETANRQAEQVLSHSDSISPPYKPNNTGVLRSNSEPNIQTNIPPKPYTKAETTQIIDNIMLDINKSEDFSGKGKDIFIQNIVTEITKLLENPGPGIEQKRIKQLQNIQLHLADYLHLRSSTPEEIKTYLSRVKTYVSRVKNDVSRVGGKTRKHKIKSNRTKKYKRVSKKPQSNKNKSIRTKITQTNRQSRKHK